MAHPNLDLIDQFFAAYGQRDLAALRQVTAEDFQWTFPGQHPLSGRKIGLTEVLAFFDAMGALMGASSPSVEQLVTGVNDTYAAQCQRVTTRRPDGLNLDQEWCVLWGFRDGKIASGRHLAADQPAVDAFFNALLTRPD